MAGSAKAAEPVSFVVLRDQAQKEALARCGDFTPHLVSAPLVIALVLEPELGAKGAPFTLFRGPFDAGRAAQNMMVAVRSGARERERACARAGLRRRGRLFREEVDHLVLIFRVVEGGDVVAGDADVARAGDGGGEFAGPAHEVILLAEEDEHG